MAKKRRDGRSHRPKEVSLDELLEKGRRDRHMTSDAQPSLRDGDSGKGGDPYWDAEDEITTDNDVGDTAPSVEPEAGIADGAVGGTPARGRAPSLVRHGISSSGSTRGDSTIGSDPAPKRRR
jgi:hypothetical protein